MTARKRSRPVKKRATTRAGRRVKMKTCGDYGGWSDVDDRPCQMAAGEGTPTRTGPCQRHTKAALAELAEKKRKVLEALEGGTTSIITACASVGVVPTTAWRWRLADADFDDKWREAVAQSDSIRTALVEDSMFARSIAGNAHAAETIFFLLNRGDGRWKNRHEITGADGKDLIPLSLIREIIAEDEKLTADPE